MECGLLESHGINTHTHTVRWCMSLTTQRVLRSNDVLVLACAFGLPFVLFAGVFLLLLERTSTRVLVQYGVASMFDGNIAPSGRRLVCIFGRRRGNIVALLHVVTDVVVGDGFIFLCLSKYMFLHSVASPRRQRIGQSACEKL